MTYWHHRCGGGYLCHFGYHVPDGQGYEDWFAADRTLMREIAGSEPSWSPWW